MHASAPPSQAPVTERPAPQALLDALAQRFGAQYSCALAVREQHGRDEGSIQAPPPAAVVFAESTRDVQDAVRTAVQFLGGTKKVGHALRPDLGPDAAGRWLNDCLNVDRKERLTPEQLVVVLRMAREAGYHGAFDYLAREAGYKAEPVTPEETRDRLADAVLQATAALTEAMRVAATLTPPSVRAVK